MRYVPLAIVVTALAAGCGRTPKVDNPVFGPAPPRVSYNDGQSVGGEAYVNDPLDPVEDAVVGPGEIVRTVSARDGDTGVPNRAGEASTVVARVNGEPIFEGDVLEHYESVLEKARSEAPPAEFAQAKRGLIKRDLQGHIERKLLGQALKQSMAKEQYETIQDRIGAYFEEEAAEMREKAGVTTNYELARKMEEQGQSLGAVRRTFLNQQLALVYMSQNSKREFEIGRNDLLEYYQRHRADYEIEGKVLWQRFVVRFAKHKGGKTGAFKVLETAVAQLRESGNFEDVIRGYSDGPRASKGGYWDWTRRGDLKEKQVEELLFRLPVGKLSDVITTDESYEIVKVLEREEARTVPFEEVQEEIDLALRRQLREKSTDGILADLKARAEITTIFDDDEEESGVVLPFN